MNATTNENGTATKNGQHRTVTYDYRDEGGVLLFQSVRVEPGSDGMAKDFFQRQPNAQGGWIKNLKGVRLVPYRLSELLDALTCQRPVFVCEGEKDVDNLRAVGVAATTNPMGAGKWRDEYAEHLRDAEVYIIPDNDEPGRKHALAVARSVAKVATSVKILELPGLPAKGDVSDWLAAGGDKVRLLELAQAAPVWKDRDQIHEAPDDQHLLARYFAEMDPRPWRYHREEFYQHTGTHYRLVPESDVRALVTGAVKTKFDEDGPVVWKKKAGGKKPPAPSVRKVTSGLVTNVMQALKHLSLVRAEIEPPCWIGEGKPSRSDFIAMANGILDLGALLDGRQNALGPHDPDWFSTVHLPYSFQPDAECPKFEAYLCRCMEEDSDRMALLQEWAGYCLHHDTGQQKFLILEGEGQNGKSVFCAVLTALLGPSNVSNVPLELFGQRFALTSTLGKLANVASEVGEIDRIAEGVLKSFTSGDPMFFDRKGIPPVEATPTARLLLATNNLPRFSDRSSGVWRRMLLLPFRVMITEEERVLGMDKPEWWLASGELPGIFNWAVRGLERLREQGRFTCPAVCTEALNEYRKENNPSKVFLAEHCEAVNEAQTKCSDLYQAYKTWAESNGYRPLADRSFGKEVRRAFPAMKRERVSEEGKQVWVYTGIEFQAI